jgi:hypothetical protein
MRKKSKELLDNLNKITEKPKDRFAPKPSIPDTNRMWKSALMDTDIYDFPKEYYKGPWNKEVDEEGNEDYWTPYDRIYGGLYGITLIQKDGTKYDGKIYKKRRLVKGTDGNNFYQQIRVTADGRWFDNSGMPINPPAKVEEQEEKSEIGFVKPELTEEEKAEQARYKTEQEKKMLDNLK